MAPSGIASAPRVSYTPFRDRPRHGRRARQAARGRRTFGYLMMGDAVVLGGVGVPVWTGVPGGGPVMS